MLYGAPLEVVKVTGKCIFLRQDRVIGQPKKNINHHLSLDTYPA